MFQLIVCLVLSIIFCILLCLSQYLLAKNLFVLFLFAGQILLVLAFYSSIHHKEAFILKFKMLVFCSPPLNSTCLFLLSIKFMLKLSKLLKESVLNKKYRCSLLFICSCSVKGEFTYYDFPIINFQLLILSIFITPRILYAFLFISAICPSLSSLPVDKNLCCIIGY